MDKEEEFIQGLYDEANNQLNEVYKEQKANRDDLLSEIASILLTYTIVNDIMGMSKQEISREFNRLSKTIVQFSKGQATLTEGILSGILTNTTKNTFDFYGYNAKLKDVQKIIEDNFKGKHFSERVWDNETEVAKHLHKQVNDFLQGKVNVNQIKKDIEKTFNNSAYEVRRLTETEVNRVEDESFRRFCKETGVTKVKRNEILDSKICGQCAELDGQIYNLDNAPGVVHPLCRGFNSIVDDNANVTGEKKQPLVMNLQLFGVIKDQENLNNLIKSGVVDEHKFIEFKNQLNDNFRYGIKTPLGIVRNNGKREYHIAFRHRGLMNVKNSNRIKETLENPECIKEAMDSNGSVNKGYIKKYGSKTLLVISNGDIITAYYPARNYLKNKVEGWRVLWEEK